MRTIRVFLKILLILLAVVVVAVVGLLGWLSIAEYRPGDVETLTVTAGARHEQAETGKMYKLVTLNIGYGGLGRDEDCFMDGGKGVLPRNQSEVEGNLSGLLSALSLQDADICFLQETDLASKRSYNINEMEYFSHGLSMGFAFAYNYRCPFVPFPWPPIGKVGSGLTTLNDLAVTSAVRQSLPVPFGWPVRVANLKRCLLVERVPIANSEQELILINLHMEAYSSEEGRKAQMAKLAELLEKEYAKGNYVIAGGDFNQVFAGSLEKYPLPENPYWTPGTLSEEDLPEGFTYACDLSVPSCRALDKPYDGNRDTLTAYVIDGFIVSANVRVNSVKTVDLNFRNTDHQPVTLEFTLK
ncbi:MAG: endonuclease [Eubacteriales bacterium]|nr:endonuclease [Eubacteriales bacterium]